MNDRCILTLILVLILLLGVSSSYAQQYEDVVYLKDGGVRRGLILEQIPGQSVKLKTSYGEIFVLKISDIEKIIKEEYAGYESVYMETKNSRNKIERWYTYWSIGYANMRYTDELNDFFVEFKRAADPTRFSMSMDLLGFYWPLDNQQTIVGAIYNGSADRYSSKYDNDNYIEAMSGQFSFSAMHFIRGGIGEGPFLRTDIGWGSFSLQDDEGNNPLEYWEKDGLSALVGLGYGFPIVGGGTRILFNVNYAMRPGIEYSEWDRTASGSVQALSVTIGGLF